MKLNDGAKRVFINTKGKDSENHTKEFLDLMEYINHSTDETAGKTDSKKIRHIHERVKKIRKSEKMGVKLMQHWEEIYYEKMEARAEGLAEGHAEGRAEVIANMLRCHLALETIIKCSGSPKEDILKLAQKLNIQVNES